MHEKHMFEVQIGYTQKVPISTIFQGAHDFESRKFHPKDISDNSAHRFTLPKPKKVWLRDVS